MTQDEIIEMARQAGIDAGNDTLCRYGGWIEPLEDFAKLVADKEQEKFSADLIEYGKAMAAVEREACAKFIEDGYVRQFEKPWREDLSAAIRARGEA